jgi:hypothetical protein
MFEIMNVHSMPVQGLSVLERFAAKAAQEPLGLVRVDSSVIDQVRAHLERLATNFAHIGTMIDILMNSLIMVLNRCLSCGSKVTLVTLERLLAGVPHHVQLEPVLVGQLFPTQVAVVLEELFVGHFTVLVGQPLVGEFPTTRSTGVGEVGHVCMVLVEMARQ